MGRSPCCSKDEVNRGAWTAIEDKKLIEYIKNNGEGKWRSLPKKAGLKRCGKSCRLRWLNYLRPGIKRGNITHDEEELIIKLHKLLGNRWSLIAGRLPGRTDNEVKNYWNTIIGKKLQNPKKTSASHEDHAPSIPNARPNSDPGVIWTRPSRCNKVTIPPELLSNEGDNDFQRLLNGSKLKPAPTPALPISQHDENSQLELLGTHFSADCNDSSNLFMDFELEDQFLSDFLDSNLSQQTKREHGAASDVSSISDQKGQLYPNSNQANFFEESALHDYSNFPAVESLIESEFEWVV